MTLSFESFSVARVSPPAFWTCSQSGLVVTRQRTSYWAARPPGDASQVSVDLHPVGDPEISGAIATVVCDRTVRQIIMKRPMQASDRVRIVLNRRGAGWVIRSIDRVSQ